MATITTRAGKGSPLTNAEVDANFTNLNNGKLENSSNLSDLANAATARSNLGLGNVNNTSDTDKPVSAAQQTALNAKANLSGAAFTGNVTISGTLNGTTLTSAATGFTLAGGTVSKKLTVSNTLTLAGTDNSTLNIEAGGTLGSAAYTASTAYAPAAGSSSVATLGTVTSGTWKATAIAVANGGTGATSAEEALVNLKERTSATGSIKVASGTTAQRDASPVAGYFRYNSETQKFEGYNGTTWGSIGGDISSSAITTALGYTPYNATNPAGYITISSVSWANLSGKPTTLAGYGITDAAASSHTHSYLPLAGGALTGLVTGQTSGLSMSQDGGATVGSFVCRASGTGDNNLAGMTFHNDSYAIKMGIRADGYFGIGGWSRAAWSWYSTPNGDTVAAGNVAAYSDERRKTNWRDVDPQLIEQLAQVKHGVYDRIDEDLTQIGVSAQSLQKVMAEAVITNPDGYLSISYGNAALVAAIQLAKRVVELEDRINTLDRRLKGD